MTQQKLLNPNPEGKGGKTYTELIGSSPHDELAFHIRVPHPQIQLTTKDQKYGKQVILLLTPVPCS